MTKVNVYEFKTKAVIEFNRVTNRFEVIKDNQILGAYAQYTPASIRASLENAV